MQPKIQRKYFRDIKHERGALKWKDCIPDETPIYDVSYPHGYIIGDHTGKHKGLDDVIDIEKPLGMLIDGKAELYEEYIANQYMVYRPIRLIDIGDLFGDFSFLDSICCQQDNEISRRGETWKVCSGFISVIITQRISTAHRSRYINEVIWHSTIKCQHRITHNYLGDDRPARVAFFDAGLMSDNQEFLADLFLYSWPRAKIYRDCLNSFNFTQLQIFRQEAKEIVDRKLGLKRNTKSEITDGRYGRALDRTTYMDYFIDAIWDAYNRPIRAEPMFARATEVALGSAMKKFSEIGVSIDNILIASDSANGDELWFPIDMNNYLIAANYPYFRLDENEQMVVDINLNKRADRLMKNIAPKKRKNNENMSLREFYKDLCGDLICILSRSHEGYPFDVSCVDCEGIEDKHWILMLHFKRRP